MGRVCASLDAIPDALGKTGFVLEHQVAEVFKEAGWSTIGGRYYADDVDGRARELDLVAYKSFNFTDVKLIYSVLVSCKKDAENTWAFLTRDKPNYDPNFDWGPVHYWTDVGPLETYLRAEDWKQKFRSQLGGAWTALAASRDVFAFQQINSKKVVPQNDSAIFSSITTLMKGLDYELMALPQRQKGQKRIYLFSLLSVVDAPLVEVKYSDKAPRAVEVDAITYFARYMVRKREVSALMRFIRSEELAQEIGRIDALAIAASKFVEQTVATSFEAIKTSDAIRSYFSSKIESRLGWWLTHHLGKHRFESSLVKVTSLGYEQGVLKLMLDGADEDSLAFLNGDDETSSKTRKILKEVARYDGAFQFEWDIPF